MQSVQMSTKAVERQRNKNGRSASPQDAKESSGSSTMSTAASYANGHDRPPEVNISVCGDSDGDSSIAADDSLCATPTQRKFKVPSQRPKTSKSEKRRVSSASFSHEHSTVLELEREVRKLLAERNQLSKQLYTSKHENTKLEGKVQVAVRDKSALLSQMASLSKHNRDLSRGKSILLAKAFSMDVRKTRSLEQSLKQANREKRAKQKELEKLNIQMNMSSKQMQEKLLASLDEREEMEIRIEDLETDVQHLTDCQAASEEENNLLKESLTSQEEACKGLQEQKSQLENTVLEKEREMEGLRERFTTETEQLKSTLQNTQDRIMKMEQHVSSLEEQLSQSSQNITNLRSQLQCAESAAESERGKIEEVEKELSESKGQLREVEDKVQSLELRVTKSSQLNSELQTELQSAREDLNREKELKKQAEEGCVAMTTELTELKTHIERVQQEHAGDLEDAHSKCSDLLSELEKAVCQGRETQSLLESRMASVEAERQKAVQAAEEVREKEAVTMTEVTRLKKEKTELEASCSTTLEQLQQAQEELATLQEQVDGPGGVLSKETVAAVQEQMTKELKEVQIQLTQQQKQSNKVQHEMRERVQDLEEELERMKSEREVLEMAYLDLQEKCRPFQDQIEGLADVNALLKSQAAIAKKEAQDVSDQFASLIGHQNSRQKIRYVKKIRDENTALKMEINQLRMELSKHKKQIRRMQNEIKTGPAPSNPIATKPLASKN